MGWYALKINSSVHEEHIFMLESSALDKPEYRIWYIYIYNRFFYSGNAKNLFPGINLDLL